jgi:hypothetical protein
MKSDLYSRTHHTEQRTGDRRLAVLASIRAARNVGRVANVVAVLLGTGIAAMLSGFGLWSPILSIASVTASLVIAIGVAWAGAVLLPRPAAVVLWFAGAYRHRLCLGHYFAPVVCSRWARRMHRNIARFSGTLSGACEAAHLKPAVTSAALFPFT